MVQKSRNSNPLQRRRVRVGNATGLVVEDSRSDGPALGGVDTERDPGKETISQLVTEVGELVERVHTLGSGLLGQDAVVGVGGDLLGVIGVRVDFVSSVDQVLVEEGLTDMAGADIVAEGAVLVDSDVGVDQDVNVGSTAGVVTGEDGVKLGHTIVVGLLDTTEEGLVNIGSIAGVTVAFGHNTGVDAGGVAVPHLKVDVGHRLASVDVNHLVVDGGGNTLLSLDNVRADVFTTNVVRALGDIRSEDAAGVAAEQSAGVGVGSVAEAGLVVVGSENAVEVPSGQAALGPGGLDLLLATGDVSCLDTAGLEFGTAVAKIADLGGSHVIPALLDLLSDGVARVSGGHARQESSDDGSGELHFGGSCSERRWECFCGYRGTDCKKCSKKEWQTKNLRVSE